MNVDVTATEAVLTNGDSCIVATVKLTNTGGRNVYLEYGSEPFSVTKISFAQGGQSTFDERVSQGLLWGSRVLRVGETDQYPLVMLVRDPGMYLVEFKVPLPEREIEEHIKAGGPPPSKAQMIYWQGSTIVNIRGWPTK